MLGIIGGTSLLDYSGSDFTKFEQDTPYGTSELFRGDGFFLLLRHQNRCAPHTISFRAHIAALKLAGADRIIAIGSTGSLRSDIVPGARIIPDDTMSLSPIPTIFNHSIDHVTPVFNDKIRKALAVACPDALYGGTYFQTRGPRLESRSEIQAMAQFAHVVGMTIASELAVATELGLPFAAICTVDNFANGMYDEEIRYDTIIAMVKQNQDKNLELLDRLIGLV